MPLVQTLPKGIKLKMVADQAQFISLAISNLKNAAIGGGLLAILVLFFFLKRFRPTLLVGLAIPLSVIATFAAMYLSGVTLNIMSLGGLALGVGMLVDNAIVVLESIARCREEGDAPRDAALRGVKEVGMAVTASTLTTVAVFFPIVFVEGIAGQVFKDLSLTVVYALMASLVMSLFFIPMLSAREWSFGGASADGKPLGRDVFLPHQWGLARSKVVAGGRVGCEDRPRTGRSFRAGSRRAFVAPRQGARAQTPRGRGGDSTSRMARRPDDLRPALVPVPRLHGTRHHGGSGSRLRR